MAKVTVNKDTCISCGACIALAPNIFEWDSDGKSKPIMEEINEESLIDKAKEAASICPTGSIKIIE
ncbi:MAG: ferredoxin [Nanopusillaceae archaeon]